MRKISGVNKNWRIYIKINLFLFLQEEIRLLFSHPDFFFCHFWGFDRCHRWTMGIAFKNNKKKNNPKTRSLYVAQAGLKPPILLPSLPTPPPCWGSRWAPPSQAASPFTPITVTLPLRCIFLRPCSAHTLILQVAGWHRRKLAAGDCWEVACHLLFGRTVYGIVFSNPISKPACQKPEPSMFLSWREASIGWGMCTNCPVWSKHPCSVRSHTDSQPIRFHPEMKIAITLLLLHSVKVDF